jgi:hypothetical protein
MTLAGKPGKYTCVESSFIIASSNILAREQALKKFRCIPYPDKICGVSSISINVIWCFTK